MQGASDPWGVIGYEVKMFNATCKRLFNPSALGRLPYELKNAVEESAVLHTRILCEVFLCRPPHWPDDILLCRLFSDWSVKARYKKIKAMIANLDKLYGPSNKQSSPCWAFNKMMAHPTSHRGTEYDYRKDLSYLRPVIQDIIVEIECLRGTRFPLRFFGPSRTPNP
jgi:hypothetical protein